MPSARERLCRNREGRGEMKNARPTGAKRPDRRRGIYSRDGPGRMSALGGRLPLDQARLSLAILFKFRQIGDDPTLCVIPRVGRPGRGTTLRNTPQLVERYFLRH